MLVEFIDILRASTILQKNRKLLFKSGIYIVLQESRISYRQCRSFIIRKYCLPFYNNHVILLVSDALESFQFSLWKSFSNHEIIVCEKWQRLIPIYYDGKVWCGKRKRAYLH